MSAARSHAILALLFITVVGGALRFGTLAVQSFGLDETFTVWLARKDFGPMLSDMSRTEGTPPAYYGAAWGWGHLFGTSEVGLRSLSALLGTATIALAGVLATKLGGRRAGAAAAILVATNPLLVWYSQEARAYALLVLLVTVSIIFLLRALERPARGRLAAWAVSAALMIATHYFAVFLVACEAVVLLRRVPRRAALGACTLPLIAAFSLLPLLSAQKHSAVSEVSGSILRRVAIVAKQLVTGPNVPGDWLIAGVAAASVFVALTAFRDADRRTTAGLPAALAAAAVVAPAALALAGSDYFSTRYILPALVPGLAALSIGFAASRRTALAAGVLAAVSLVAVALVQTHDRYQRVDYRDAARAIGAPRGSRAVVYTPKAHFEVYLDGARLMPSAGAEVRAIDVISLAFTDRGETTPPRGAAKHPPPGFQLADRRETATFTLLRYVSPVGRRVRPDMLRQLDLAPDDFPTVLVQHR